MPSVTPALSDWLLVRLAIVTVGKPPIDLAYALGLNGIDARIGGGFPGKDGLLGILGVAVVPLVGWAPDGDTILIPQEARHNGERALEILCRLLALDRATSHTVRSPMPCVGLVPPTRRQLELLDGVQVSLEPRAMNLIGGGPTEFIEHNLAGVLTDRLDGVTFLTEALNTEPGVGQFMQFWRLFERAFKCGHHAAVPLLTTFLGAGPHAITGAEVQNWADLRNPAVHANRGGDAVLNSDVFFLLGRMREAAFDVLFNKTNWWSSDDLRRDAWKPAAGSSGDGGIFLTQGRGAQLQGAIADPFGSFPMAFVAPIHSVLPDALWLDSDISGASGVSMKDVYGWVGQ